MPAPVSEKKVLKASSPPPMVLSEGIWPLFSEEGSGGKKTSVHVSKSGKSKSLPQAEITERRRKSFRSSKNTAVERRVRGDPQNAHTTVEGSSSDCARLDAPIMCRPRPWSGQISSTFRTEKNPVNP